MHAARMHAPLPVVCGGGDHVEDGGILCVPLAASGSAQHIAAELIARLAEHMHSARASGKRQKRAHAPAAAARTSARRAASAAPGTAGAGARRSWENRRSASDACEYKGAASYAPTHFDAYVGRTAMTRSRFSGTALHAHSCVRSRRAARPVGDESAPRQRGLWRGERLGLLAGHAAHDDGGVLLDEVAVFVPLCSAVRESGRHAGEAHTGTQ